MKKFALLLLLPSTIYSADLSQYSQYLATHYQVPALVGSASGIGSYTFGRYMRFNRNKTIAVSVSLWSAALTLWLTYKTSLLEQVHEIRTTVDRIQPRMVTMSDTLTVIGKNVDKSIVQDVKGFQEVNKRFDSVDTQVKDISSVCDNVATQEDIKKTMENIDKLFASMQLLQQIADKLEVGPNVHT